MISDFLSTGEYSIYAQIGTVLFVVAFGVILFWTYAGRKDRFKRESELPLDDGMKRTSSPISQNHGD